MHLPHSLPPVSGPRYFQRVTLGVILSTGEDVDPWIHGQTTQDTRGLARGNAAYGFVATTKGRVISDVWVSRQQLDEQQAVYRWVVPSNVVQDVMERLESQIVMEDVELSSTGEKVLTILGWNALGEDLRNRIQSFGICDYDSRWMGAPSRDVIATDDNMAALIEHMGTAVRPMEVWDWEQRRILSGVPCMGRELGPGAYPQEAGLGSVGMSFQKGCYVGQEVLCMLETRGKLPKRLVRLRSMGVPTGTDAALPLVEGRIVILDDAELHCSSPRGTKTQGSTSTPEDRAPVPAGRITSCTKDPSTGEYWAMGYVRRAFWDAGTVLTVEGHGSLTFEILGEVAPTSA